MRFVFLALFIAVSVFHLAASFFNKPKLRNASIAFIVLFLLLYYVFSAERKSTVLLVALITSLLGDSILIPPGFAFFAVGGFFFCVLESARARRFFTQRKIKQRRTAAMPRASLCPCHEKRTAKAVRFSTKSTLTGG